MSRSRSLAWTLAAAVALAFGPVAGLSGPVSAATVTPPDLQIAVPTNQISIGIDATTNHRMLRYTHITWDAGTGPFEIDPTYNSATGTASFVQAIYNSPSPGAWSLDHVVPLAVLGVFDQPDDYQFPLTKFTLNGVNADGSIGQVVATSPKTDYCITGDTKVGGVPNTPSSTFIPVSNCASPTSPLGWSVGWGDQYDQTDAGQPIDLNGVPDGTYILRAVADPLHVLVESDATNNVTDTVLTIKGTAVTVGAQTHPTVVPPSASVTSPAAGASVSGTVTLSATASAASPATVASVQFLLDGSALGNPITAAPYTTSWSVGSTSPGSHRLSARVIDSSGGAGTAPVVPITVASNGLYIDQTVTARGSGAVSTGAFTTAAAGETLLAAVSSDGASTGGQATTVSGAGLTWTRVAGSNVQPGDAEIWTATAPSVLSGAVVTSTPREGGYDQQLVVESFANSGGVGASSAANAPSGASAVHLAAKAAGSLTVAVGSDWDSATGRTYAAGQTQVAQWVDSPMGDTFWVQASNAPTTSAGQSVTLADTAPTADSWNMAGIEIVPASGGTSPADTAPPTVQITNPTSGQTVSGTATVAANATDDVSVSSVQFYLDGQPLGTALSASPYAISWDTTKTANGSHTLTAKATDPAGNIGTSGGVGVTVQNPAPPMTCFVQQAEVDVRGAGKVTTPSFSTVVPGEVLLAFVSQDGPAKLNSQSATVSGAGLSWKLLARSNAQYGDAEVWTATATNTISNATVTSTPAAAGYAQELTVVAYEGAKGAGAVASGSAASGAPTLTVTTTSAASLVFAVGHDWDNARARTLPTGLVFLEQWIDTGLGDTSWSEYTNQTAGPAGTQVKVGASAPTTDQWDLAAVELVGSGA